MDFKMHNPLISIIVPCYKVEEFLKDTVNCILNQTYPNWELILVDDGSPDHTGELCDAYAQKDSRIKVVHKPNGGLVSARNAGYDVVTGEWHMYLDGDDWIDTDTLERLIEQVNQKEDTDVFFWKCVHELGDTTIKGKWEWPCPETERVYTDEECKELSRNTLIYKSGIATAYCKLIRTEYAKAHNIRHDDCLKQGAEGLEFSLRVFYYAKKVVYLNTYWNHYRYNPNSISKVVNEKNTQYLMDCFDVIAEDLRKWGEYDHFSSALYERICYVVIAVAMSTYFHPSNPDNLLEKCRKFGNILKDNKLFADSIKNCDISKLDKSRKITLMLIRLKCYIPLALISWLKQYYLKKGKFNY